MEHEARLDGLALQATEPVVMALGRGPVRIAYEWVMIGLALAVAWMLTLPDEGWVRTAKAVDSNGVAIPPTVVSVTVVLAVG